MTYSDEHGEARAGFLPGHGFFFDNFGLINANNGCDLAGIATLGTASITATARYPYEPVTAAPLVSNAVAKAVSSLFVKLIQCFPKGPSAFDHQTAVCVAHAQDIDGTAFVNERVCFFSGGEGLFLPAISPIVIPDQTTWPPIHIHPAPPLNGPNNVCAYTDLNGNTAVEVFESDAETVNVGAFFVDEGLFRLRPRDLPDHGPDGRGLRPRGGLDDRPTVQQPSRPVTVNTGSNTTTTVPVVAGRQVGEDQPPDHPRPPEGQGAEAQADRPEGQRDGGDRLPEQGQEGRNAGTHRAGEQDRQATSERPQGRPEAAPLGGSEVKTPSQGSD